MPGEGSRNPLQPIQYGDVPQASNRATGDGDFTSSVDTGATSQAKASDVRKGSKHSKRIKRSEKKGHTPPVRSTSKRISKFTEKKQAGRSTKQGEEPWAVDEEVSVMLREVGKARKRAKLNQMGKHGSKRYREKHGARRNALASGEGLSCEKRVT